jgi:DNA-binding transcriptional LysR family regulator
LTLEQLRIFLAVAEREHVTRAAKALNLTQSAVSGAIQALEERHAINLFHRVGRGIQLTEEGRIFLAEARTVLAMVRSAENTLADLSGVRRGTLTIYASQTTASYWLPPHLVRFHERHPQIDLRLEVGNTAQCARAVIEGTADLGFIEGAVDEPLLRMNEVGTDRLIVVVGNDHPWKHNPPASAAQLKETEWALREAGSGTRSSFEEALAAWGIAPSDLRVAMELPSNEAICTAVETGRLATAVSEYVGMNSVGMKRLVHVPFELPARVLRMIRHRERRPSRAAEAMSELILDI